MRRLDGSRDADASLNILLELFCGALSLPSKQKQQLNEDVQAGASAQLMGASRE